MAQYITIQDYWNSAKFHCPACGAVVFTEGGEPTNKPCEHLLFSWINEVGEFYNAAEGLNELLEDDESSSDPSDDEFLSRCPDTAVLFALESSESWPVSIRVVHAFKFPMSDCDEDEAVSDE